MDLYDYFQVMRRQWLCALLGFVITAGLAVVFVNDQPSVYESTGTLVIRPRTANPSDGLRAIDTLTRGVEISSTFATVARSDLVRERAERRLDPDVSTAGLSVSSEVVTSTNILEVTVRGRDPGATHALATAVAEATVVYVAELQQVYELRQLDAPPLPDDPVAPNRPLIVGTGMVLGLGVGLIFALLAEGFSRRPGRRPLVVEPADALRRSPGARPAPRVQPRPQDGGPPTARPADAGVGREPADAHGAAGREHAGAAGAAGAAGRADDAPAPASTNGHGPHGPRRRVRATTTVGRDPDAAKASGGKAGRRRDAAAKRRRTAAKRREAQAAAASGTASTNGHDARDARDADAARDRRPDAAQPAGLPANGTER